MKSCFAARSATIRTSTSRSRKSTSASRRRLKGTRERKRRLIACWLLNSIRRLASSLLGKTTFTCRLLWKVRSSRMLSVLALCLACSILVQRRSSQQMSFHPPFQTCNSNHALALHQTMHLVGPKQPVWWETHLWRVPMAIWDLRLALQDSLMVYLPRTLWRDSHLLQPREQPQQASHKIRNFNVVRSWSLALRKNSKKRDDSSGWWRRCRRKRSKQRICSRRSLDSALMMSRPRSRRNAQRISLATMLVVVRAKLSWRRSRIWQLKKERRLLRCWWVRREY